MSREFPDSLNPKRAAEGRRTFEGTMPLARMQRLASLLVPAGLADTGAGDVPVVWRDVRFRADFALDRDGFVTIRLRVEAELPLECQRSLSPYVEHVRRDTLLAVVGSMAEQETLPDHYEPIWVEDGRLALLEAVEDELLLAMPQVPRNPAVEAVDLSTGSIEQGAGSPLEDAGGKIAESGPTRRPFEGLAALMRKREKE